MRQQNFREVGWFASAIVVSSYLPGASACDTSGFISGGCSFSESTMIGLIIGGGVFFALYSVRSSEIAAVALILFIVICSAYVRRRRIRSRPGRIRRMSMVNVPCNDMEAHTLTPQKPWNTPVAYGYPGYGQPSSPVSWPAQALRYPPPTHDTQYTGHRSDISSYWSSPATFHSMPEPSTPTSPLSTRTSSSAIISRPVPASTIPASVRPAVQRDETIRMRSHPSSSSTPRSPQNNVTDTPLPTVPSSPRSPQTIVAESSPTPASSAPTPQSRIVTGSAPPSAPTNPPSGRPPPSAVLSPMATGATSNITEPPPPYTLM